MRFQGMGISVGYNVERDICVTQQTQFEKAIEEAVKKAVLNELKKFGSITTALEYSEIEYMEQM